MPRKTECRELDHLLLEVAEVCGSGLAGYKRPTLKRHIDKRLPAVGASSYAEYMAYIRSHPEECDALIDMVHVNVTAFFRDRPVWDELASRIVPMLVSRAAGRRQIRVWCVGCASGEEAYSIAILFADAVGLETCADAVRIFATDIDPHVVDQARQGSYGASALKGIAPGTLAAYFDQEGDIRSVKRDLRRSVVVGRHDVLANAPLAKMDLIVCRNLLIYLESTKQQEVLGKFAFSLVPGGILVLGNAEDRLSASTQYETISRKHRIFRKVGQGPETENGTGLPQYVRGAGSDGRSSDLVTGAFDNLAKACVVLDEHDRMVVVNTAAREWFRVSHSDIGRPFRDLDVSFRPLELRSLVELAQTTHSSVLRDDVPWSAGPDNQRMLRCTVSPITDDNGRSIGTSIVFQDVSELFKLRADLARAIQAREQIAEERRTTSDELETTNEELKSTNEELETLNEELLATNAELETTNDELRATNDRLEAINHELKVRGDQLASYRQSMEALLTGHHMSVVGVDSSCRIVFWNADSERIWGIRVEDAMSRNIFDIEPLQPLAALRAKIESVAAGTATWASGEFRSAETEGHVATRHVYVVPSLALGHDVVGALLLIEDVSDRIRLESHVRQVSRLSRALMEVTDEPMIVLDQELQAITANRAACELLDLDKAPDDRVPLADLGNGALGGARFSEAFARLAPFVSSTERFAVDTASENDRRRRWEFRAIKVPSDEATGFRILLRIRVTDVSRGSS